MTDATVNATTIEAVPTDEPRVPWWSIESPLRRRIKGRYVRRAAIAVAALNALLLTGALDAPGAAMPEGLRPGLDAPAAPALPPLARMASATP